MEAYSISDYTKAAIGRSDRAIRYFIHNAEVRRVDERAYENLLFELDCNRIGIPTQIQDKLDLFVHDYLEPMVYDPDWFSTPGIITYEKLKKISEARHEVMEAWNNLAMSELHPYFMI